MARRHVPARHLNASGDDTRRSYSAFGHSSFDVDIFTSKLCEIAALKSLRKRWEKD